MCGAAKFPIPEELIEHAIDASYYPNHPEWTCDNPEIRAEWRKLVLPVLAVAEAFYREYALLRRDELIRQWLHGLPKNQHGAVLTAAERDAEVKDAENRLSAVREERESYRRAWTRAEEHLAMLTAELRGTKHDLRRWELIVESMVAADRSPEDDHYEHGCPPRCIGRHALEASRCGAQEDKDNA